MAYDITPLAEKIRSAGSSGNTAGAVIVFFGMVLAGTLLGPSESEKLAKKQKKLDVLVSWGSWAYQNCAQPKAGEPLYVCNDGRRFYAMPAADLEASRQCVENIKTCARVPDPPAMLPALASR